MPLLHLHSLIAVFILPSFVLADAPKKSSELAPQKAEGGVLLQYSAPGASTVYLAGDFNNWANNDNGTINGAEFKMDGPDAKGVWRKVLKLDAGAHKFKFSIDGAADKWFAPDWAAERDEGGNAMIYVTAHGDALVRNPINPEWKPRQKDGKVTFRVYSPAARGVYLAGDFNNWADNQEGVVSDSKFAMTKTDTDGLWQAEVAINPGRHAYKFVIDGDKWERDPNVDEKDGEDHSIIEVK
jgi:1,4-alpha-glucan branching enzyme